MMLPPMGFNAGPHAGSDYSQSLLPPQFPGMGAPRNTMMSLKSYAGSMPGGPASSYGGGNFPNQLGLGGGMGNARMSTFSLATTANLFGATPPSESIDPTDDEILAELRHYLSSQDLMTVTKKSVSTSVVPSLALVLTGLLHSPQDLARCRLCALPQGRPLGPCRLAQLLHRSDPPGPVMTPLLS